MLNPVLTFSYDTFTLYTIMLHINEKSVSMGWGFFVFLQNLSGSWPIILRVFSVF